MSFEATLDIAHKIVTRLPLQELWREEGFTTTLRSRSVTKDDVTDLLRVGPVQFVVIDVGFSPVWIAPSDCYEFWKSEAKSHIASESRAALADFPEDYCYFASQWNDGKTGEPIIVLEKHH
jgi:hypothetical protein